jgi:DNA-binding response OmpR family regulator
MAETRLLVIEDDFDVAEMLILYFGAYNIAVYHAESGAIGLEMARVAFPHVILLDIGLPDMDGYEICRHLRESALMRYVPIIFLTQKDARANKVQGLELGADDYVTKPFDVDELRLRVQSVIRRATRENLHEPRTGLPTGELVHETIAERQQAGAVAERWLSLEGYRAYCDVYGFLAGNDVMAFAAKTLREALTVGGSADDFLGVVDDHFVLLTAPARVDAIVATAQAAFSAGIQAFYAFADVDRGGVLVDPNTVRERLVPIMSLVPLAASVA